MRGYFGVGVEGVSKPMNLGNLVRIAHAFDASFFFSIAPRLKLSDANSDTSNAEGQLPFYSFEHPDDFRLPLGCRLVGVEITDDATLTAAVPPSPARRLYLWGRALFAVAPDAVSVRIRSEDPDPFFHQCRHGRRHRALRPDDDPGRLW